MPKKYKNWLDLVSQNNYPPVLGIGGEEKFLVNEAIRAIKNVFCTDMLSCFNIDTVTAKTFSMRQIISYAEIFSLALSNRLVIVNDADSVSKESNILLEKYLKSPNPRSVLLFIFDKFDLKNKLQSELIANKIFYSFDHPNDRDMINIIRERTNKYRLIASKDIIDLLRIEIGNNISLLERALEKLALVCNNRIVTKKMIEDQIAQVVFQDSFDLVHALVLKDKRRVIENCIKLKKRHENPINLIGLIAWQFRIILKVKIYMSNGLNESEIASKLNLYGFRLRIAIEAAKFTNVKLQIKHIGDLVELDRKLKTAKISLWLIFDSAVMQLCDNC